jgi:hypothetical protein
MKVLSTFEFCENGAVVLIDTGNISLKAVFGKNNTDTLLVVFRRSGHGRRSCNTRNPRLFSNIFSIVLEDENLIQFSFSQCPTTEKSFTACV